MNTRFNRTCSISDCPTPVWAREMCRKHYMRWHEHGDPLTVLVQQSPAGAPQAFIDALPAIGEGCVRWPFTTNNMGYAQLVVRGTKGRKLLVSRLVCERIHGPAPSATHQAAHACGKGHEACIAPWHLSWKTPAENVADAFAHGTASHGERHPSAKLTAAQVAEIIALKGTASQAALGERFGVSQTAIGHIHRGRSWKRSSLHLPPGAGAGQQPASVAVQCP